MNRRARDLCVRCAFLLATVAMSGVSHAESVSRFERQLRAVGAPSGFELVLLGAIETSAGGVATVLNRHVSVSSGYSAGDYVAVVERRLADGSVQAAVVQIPITYVPGASEVAIRGTVDSVVFHRALPDPGARSVGVVHMDRW